MASVRERIQAIQRRLGLSPDGIIGPITLTRIEAALDAALPPATGLEVLPAPKLVVSERGLDTLVAFEVSSEAFYEARLQKPIWPGARSGVTIGIGYDLGHTARSQIERDWRGRLPDADVDKLLSVEGKQGTSAKNVLSSVKNVVVPLAPAKQVFYTSTLPRFASNTRQAYPGIENLPADAQAMLLSLVFNRGGSMTGSRRREMKAIKPLVVAKDLAGIAAQIRSMKRLWDINRLRGLHERRDKEAKLIEGADRTYDPNELVTL
jgi:hypothetical protein